MKKSAVGCCFLALFLIAGCINTSVGKENRFQNSNSKVLIIPTPEPIESEKDTIDSVANDKSLITQGRIEEGKKLGPNIEPEYTPIPIPEVVLPNPKSIEIPSPTPKEYPIDSMPVPIGQEEAHGGGSLV